MSSSKQQSEAERWLATARDDLNAAQALFGHDMFAHAGFLAQQAAEKAVKALHFHADADPWGHSITRLIDDLPTPELVALRDEAMGLDKLYIPTRYPDALPGLTPSEAFTRDEASRALAAAENFLRVAAQVISG